MQSLEMRCYSCVMHQSCAHSLTHSISCVLSLVQYLYEHGAKKFFQWFDYMSWYPLGRPVGTTIYPGMQFTAVFIKNHIVGDAMSLNDVCCYIPAWLGVIATILTGMVAYECTLECNSSTNIIAVLWSMISSDKMAQGQIDKKNQSCAPVLAFLFSMAAMSVIPAHLMRSVGGGYDNESVAMSAMMMTFYFWVRSLRAGEDKSYLFGVLTGVAYFYVSFVWHLYAYMSHTCSHDYSLTHDDCILDYYRWWQLGVDTSLS